MAMESLDILNVETWNPLGYFGIEHDLLKLNALTIKNTWAVLFILLIVSCILRMFLYRKKSMVHFLVTSGLYSSIELVTQALGKFIYAHFACITALFIYIVLCNTIALIPWLDEPTKDLNTTFALGCIAFFYKEFYTIKVHGFGTYIKEFFHPFFIMFPLNVVGHFSKIISISFRLFGNIFGGSVIVHIYQSAIAGSIIWELLGIVSGLNLIMTLFFILFEGIIQAFVFTMLSLTYLAIAIQPESEGEPT